MPSAAMRPCLGSCGRAGRWPRGRCPACARTTNQHRREGRTLTYSEPWWRRWRLWFIAQLVRLNVVPCCGATHPAGPSGAAHRLSRCYQQGILTGVSDRGSLHLHHEPELTEAEASDRNAVMDLTRIVLLCSACHNSTSSSRQHRMAS